MKKYNLNNKIFLLLITIILLMIFYFINNKIIYQFRSELNNQVNTIINAYRDKVVNNDDSDDLLQVIVPLIDELNIPMIIKTQLSDSTFTYEHLNLDVKYDKNSIEYRNLMEKTIIMMDQNFKPLPLIEYNNKPIIQIHYGDTDLIKIIKLIPYIGFFFALLMVLLVVSGINIINLSEKNFIYVGMAKETAHQLGTPISSLMGWIQILKSKTNNNINIINELEKETNHLKNISEKFSKIGSNPKLSKLNLNKILQDLVLYFSKRLPESKDIKIDFISHKEFFIDGDEVLLYWSFENILKNSIEAIKDKNGKIEIKLYKHNKNINIDFIDNGSGIQNSDKNKIFKPGFSTKQRGWGLGLSLSQRIIRNIHHGNIKLLKSNGNTTIISINFKNSYS